MNKTGKTPIRSLALGAIALAALPAWAIDDSVYTELTTYGALTQEQLDGLSARRTVVEMAIRDGRLDPPEVHVTADTVVVFRNGDAEEKHFIYVTPGENNDLRSNALTKMIEPGEMWAASYTFGEYPFYCARHKDRDEERGLIVVSP